MDTHVPSLKGIRLFAFFPQDRRNGDKPTKGKPRTRCLAGRRGVTQWQTGRKRSFLKRDPTARMGR